jgi:hypothetical protein
MNIDCVGIMNMSLTIYGRNAHEVFCELKSVRYWTEDATGE